MRPYNLTTMSGLEGFHGLNAEIITGVNIQLIF
jgi:hypothetical protein